MKRITPATPVERITDVMDETTDKIHEQVEIVDSFGVVEGSGSTHDVSS